MCDRSKPCLSKPPAAHTAADMSNYMLFHYRLYQICRISRIFAMVAFYSAMPAYPLADVL